MNINLNKKNETNNKKNIIIIIMMEFSKTEENIKIEMRHNNIYKIIIFGDSNVGKSTLISKYLTGKFQECPMSTLTTEFAIKLIEIDGGGYIKAQIWDTPGQEQYREITFHHMKKFLGGIIIYDISKRSTYDSIPSWVKILKSKCEKDCIIALVGNKLDLVEKKITTREVSKQEAETYAFLNHFLFFETSANFEDSNKIFDELLQTIYNEKRKIFYRSDMMDDNSKEGNSKSIVVKKGRNCYDLSYENSQEEMGCKCSII